MDIEAGAVFDFSYPFVRSKVTLYDQDGGYEADTWKPGVEYRFVQPDDSEAFADGMGRQIVTVVSLHKPGRFPARVFYTRQWVDPDGKTFGSTRLFIKTSQAFKRLVKGYRFEFNPPKSEAA